MTDVAKLVARLDRVVALAKLFGTGGAQLVDIGNDMQRCVAGPLAARATELAADVRAGRELQPELERSFATVLQALQNIGAILEPIDIAKLAASLDRFNEAFEALEALLATKGN